MPTLVEAGEPVRPTARTPRERPPFPLGPWALATTENTAPSEPGCEKARQKRTRRCVIMEQSSSRSPTSRGQRGAPQRLTFPFPVDPGEWLPLASDFAVCHRVLFLKGGTHSRAFVRAHVGVDLGLPGKHILLERQTRILKAASGRRSRSTPGRRGEQNTDKNPTSSSLRGRATGAASSGQGGGRF